MGEVDAVKIGVHLVHARAELAVVGNPGTARMLVAEHAEPRPVLEFLVHPVAGGERHEPERVTGQIDERRASSIAWQREALAQAPQGITGIQIAGVPERHEPDVGEINYPYLFALLDELGYDGWIGCEYRPAGGSKPGATSAGLRWLSQVKKGNA